MLNRLVGVTSAAACLVLGAAALSACGGGGQAAVAGAEASPGRAAQFEYHGLHNVHRLGDGIISGGVPEGDTGFEELAAMGVKTIISVDGAAPDVERARAHGLRYVHIPITYAEVTPEEQVAIARAIRDLPGPVYVHCHHGKHRAPAAAAAAAVNLGILSAEQAVAYMKTAGTSESYAGLYACVLEADAATEAELDAAPDEFPESQRAQGMVAAMVEIEQAFDLLGEIRTAGWRVPADHPDLVPAAEAGRLTDNFRFAAEGEEARDLGEDHLRRLLEVAAQASELEEGIIRGDAPEKLSAQYKLIDASCKSCHGEYRNNRR